MTGVTETLAHFVISDRTDTLPEAAFTAARDAFVDTIGVMVAGSGEPVARAVESLTGKAASGCMIMGSTGLASPAEAAFINGVFAHALDFDDSLPTSRSHPSAPLIPAILAAAEDCHANGRDALAAFILGIETTGRLGKLLGDGHYLRGWHSTATIGAFAATAAAARLYGLSQDGLRMAWGLTSSQAGGLVRNFGTMAKPFHAGNAARIGVTSVQLVRAGLTANMDALDGEGGFLEMYAGEDGQAPEAALSGLGESWTILAPGLFVKRWPCCYANHRSIGGLLEIIAEQGIATNEVQAIRVGFPPEADRALLKRKPVTGLEAKFSIEFCLAATLLDGNVMLSTFRDEMLTRPDIASMMERIVPFPMEDDGVYSGISGYNELHVKTARGTFTRLIDRVPGSAAWPLSGADREAKFLSCIDRAMTPEAGHAFLERLNRIGDYPDLSGVFDAAAAQREEPPVRGTAYSSLETVDRKLS